MGGSEDRSIAYRYLIHPLPFRSVPRSAWLTSRLPLPSSETAQGWEIHAHSYHSSSVSSHLQSATAGPGAMASTDGSSCVSVL